jgi:hypothetical protein
MYWFQAPPTILNRGSIVFLKFLDLIFINKIFSLQEAFSSHAPVHRDSGSLRFAPPSAVSPSGHHALASRSYSQVHVSHAPTSGQSKAARAALHHLPLPFPVSPCDLHPSDIHCQRVVFTRQRQDLFCQLPLPSSALPTTDRCFVTSFLFYTFMSFLFFVVGFWSMWETISLKLLFKF